MSEAVPAFLQLKVFTPQKLLVEEDVQEVSLPSLEGLLGILPGHRPLLVVLGDGDLSCKSAHKERTFTVSGGYAEVQTDSVRVFTRLKDKNGQESDQGRG
ncbi:MAG: F0F1 ATP synthase subunit epsilon [Candidatus Aminicenantes bacterium]|jgi:F-type H+-transporting ATPase subunit epsilon